MAFSASERDLNLTRADPVNLEFLRIMVTSRIVPYSEKNFCI